MTTVKIIENGAMTSAIAMTEEQKQAAKVASENGETEFVCEDRTFKFFDGQWLMVLTDKEMKDELGLDKIDK